MNKNNDNPLLRSLECKKHHKALASLVGDSKSTQRRAPSRSKAQTKGNSHSIAQFEENQSIAFDSDGLSDFVVNDSSSLGEESPDSDCQPLPPRSIRRLVRGVKKRSSVSLLEVSEVRPMRNDQAKDGEAKSPIPVVYVRELHSRGIDSELPESNDNNAKGLAGGAGRQKSPVLLSQDRITSSGLEQPCALLKL